MSKENHETISEKSKISNIDYKKNIDTITLTQLDKLFQIEKNYNDISERVLFLIDEDFNISNKKIFDLYLYQLNNLEKDLGDLEKVEDLEVYADLYSQIVGLINMLQIVENKNKEKNIDN